MIGFSLHQDIQTNIVNQQKDMQNDTKIEVVNVYNIKNKKMGLKNQNKAFGGDNGQQAQKIESIL